MVLLSVVQVSAEFKKIGGFGRFCGFLMFFCKKASETGTFSCSIENHSVSFHGMHILVTGGAGFIGSHLVEHLVRDGHRVSVLDDFNDFYDPEIKRSNLSSIINEIQLFEIDLRNEEAVTRVCKENKFDSIVHLAARAGVRPSIQAPKLYLDTNIGGTFHLLEAAKIASIPKFIFASSSSVYGISKTAPFREDMPISQTISPYAATKLACEQLCSNYSHLYQIQTICLRFFTVYGPRQRPDLAIHKFTEKIHAGEPIPQFGDGTSRRDYTYIDDIIQGVLASFDYPEPFDIFNLGENQTTQLKDLIKAIEEAVGKKAIIEYLPEQPGDVPMTCADITKAQRLLNYRPTTKIAQGIPKFVNWFLTHHTSTRL